MPLPPAPHVMGERLAGRCYGTRTVAAPCKESAPNVRAHSAVPARTARPKTRAAAPARQQDKTKP